MSDNSYTGTYGPSTPGTLNVIAGQTYGVACSAPGASFAVFNSPGACAAPGVTPTLPGSPLLFSATPTRDVGPSPTLGQHTDEVLRLKSNFSGYILPQKGSRLTPHSL